MPTNSCCHCRVCSEHHISSSFAYRIAFALHSIHTHAYAFYSLEDDALESDPGLIEEVPDDDLELDQQEYQGKHQSIPNPCKSILVNECPINCYYMYYVVISW